MGIQDEARFVQRGFADDLENFFDVLFFLFQEIFFAHAEAREHLKGRTGDAPFVAGAVFEDDDAQFFQSSSSAWSQIEVGPLGDDL